MARRSSRAPLMAGMDMFICFAAVLFVILGQPQAEIDQQIAQKEEELKLLDQVVDTRREERRELETQTRQAVDEAQARSKRAEEEAQAKVAELEREIASTREQLAKRQQSFADWDVVVDRFRKYSDVNYAPDYHFYLRSGGIYSSMRPSDKWTAAGLKSWLEQIISESEREPYIVFYMENGANDQVRTVRQVVDEVNRPTQRVIMSTVTLPSGVVAGSGYHLNGDPQ